MTHIFVMQTNYVKISYEDEIFICHIKFVKQIKHNMHETTS